MKGVMSFGKKGKLSPRYNGFGLFCFEFHLLKFAGTGFIASVSVADASPLI